MESHRLVTSGRHKGPTVHQDADGIDSSRDYIETKSANAFNWVRLNMGSGTHTVVLYGDLAHFATAGSAASAYVGNRSMIGLPGKFSNVACAASARLGRLRQRRQLAL